MASGFIYFEQTIPETLRRKKKQAGKQEKTEHWRDFSEEKTAKGAGRTEVQ